MAALAARRDGCKSASGKVTGFDFVYWDDQLHVFDNPYFQDFSVHDISHFWTHPYQQLYVPLSYTAFGLLVVLAHRPYGSLRLTSTDAMLDPHIFHTANLLLHCFNVVLLFFLLRRLTRSDLGSVLGAVVFAIHPIQVESVAWVSELRGLLAASFTFSTLHLYLSYLDTKNAGNFAGSRVLYGAAILLSACAMLSKPSSVIICLLIAAIGYWHSGRSMKQISMDAAPFIPFGVVVICATALVQGPPLHQVIAIWQRPFVAGDAVSFYLWKLVAPFNFTIDYGRTPTWVMGHWWAYVEWLIPALLACLAYAARRLAPYVGFGLCVVLVGLLPVLGLAPFVFQSFSTTADRYMYLPMAGIATIAAHAIAAVPSKWKPALIPACLTCVICCSFASYHQAQYWRDSGTLFAHAVTVNPRSAVAQDGLGQILDQQNNLGEAKIHLLSAVELAPGSALYRDTLGGVCLELGETREAEDQFRAGIALNPRSEKNHRDLGTALLADREYASGVEELTTALQLNPSDYLAADKLSEYYLRNQRYSEALGVAAAALRNSPNVGSLWRNLGLALYYEHSPNDAIDPLKRAVQLNPNDQLAAAALRSICTSDASCN